MTRRWEEVARADAGDDYADAYARRFAALAARGDDTHGEAQFVEQLLPAPARVLDAGCGTGRVAARLHDRGYDVVGCDADPRMITVARRIRPALDWRVCDLAAIDELAAIGRFDLAILAGNVVPLLEAGTLAAAALGLERVVAPGGFVVAGFGLDTAHLPAGCPPVALADVDDAMLAAGLLSAQRWASWDREGYTGRGYAVAVYRADRA
jgi:SAM-dependent methyltransferase